jgi:hypothetical protein
MSTENTRNPSGGPAFPRSYSQDPTGEYKSHPQKGLSAALYLAGQALMLVSEGPPEVVAKEALDIANAILDEHYLRYGF